jgi:ABC-type polysaccharide/polyol phosphate export permease
MMIIFTQIFARVAKIDTGAIPYPVFVYCGLLPWQFFSSALKGSVESLTRNSRLVTKIYMPREVFPVSQVISSFVDFLVASVVLCGLLAWYRVPIQTTAVFVPTIVVVQVALTTGLALMLSMANLFYRDVKYVFEVVILMWMFATSVVYPIRLDGAWAWVVAANPMTPIIDSYRRVLLEGQWPDPLAFGYASLVALAVMVGAFRWFHESEHLFAENI